MADKFSQKHSWFWRYVDLSWHMVWLNVSSQMEYRLSFISQVLGIMFNDFTHIVLWMIFFDRFTTINGWQFHDMMLLLSVFLVIFGWLEVYTGGLPELAKYIARGELDYFLTFPKNVLWHSSVSKSDIAGIGDVLLALIIFFFLTGPLTVEKIVVYTIVTLLSTLILINFTIITQSLAFFFGNFEESADRWLWTLFGIALYPQTIFGGWLKVITLTLLPSFFLVYLPVSLLQKFSWPPLLILGAFCLGTFLLAAFVFYRGLRRYESGNLINVRV